MSYEIDIDNTLKIIEVKHERSIDIDEIYAAREETARHLADNGFRKVFVDIRNATMDVTTMEIFGFSASYRDLLQLDVRIAIVYSPESVNREDVLFSETAARNRGILLRIFTEKDEALDWFESPESII